MPALLAFFLIYGFLYATTLPVLLIQYVASFTWLVRKKFPQFTTLEQLILSTFLGFVANATVVFLLGHLIGTGAYVVSYFFFGVGVIQLPILFSLVKKSLPTLRRHWLVSVGVGICAFSLASTLMFSWWYNSAGLHIQAGQLHDSAWHVALIHTLNRELPPSHPVSFSESLHNYHYFYDLIVAIPYHNFHLGSTFIYFQVMPLITSLLLAASAMILVRRIAPKGTALPYLFLIFFGGSLAYVIPFFLNRPWHESSFWVSQTFASMVNPQLIFSLAQLNLFFWLLSFATPKKKNEFQWWLHAVIIFLTATSIGMKSYGFVIMGFLYGVFLLWQLITTRKWQYVVVGILFAVVALPFMWLITGFNSSSFFWFPLWYLTSMIEAQDRVYYPNWRLLEDHYIAAGNWARVAEIKLKELIIFYIGNLGTRAVFFLLPLFVFQKRLKVKFIHVLIAVGFLFSSIFPLLFLQRGAVWNSIQFWYYALICADVLAALTLYELWQMTKKWKPVTVVGVIIFVALTIPTYLQTMQIKLQQSETISGEHIELLFSGSDHRTLVCPSAAAFYQTSLPAAIGQGKFYLINPVQLSIVGREPVEQEKELNRIFTNNDEKALRELVTKEHITHVLCDSPSSQKMVDGLSDKRLWMSEGWYLKPVN